MRPYFLLFIIYFFISCNKEYHQNIIKNALGVDNTEHEILCGTDELSFQGEGFSVFEYKLKEDDINSFLNSNIDKYPQRVKYREKWSVLKWKKTPILEEDETLYSHVKSYYKFDENKCLNTKDIDNVIFDENNYYSAFYYDENKKEPLSVDFFILDIKRKTLYFISNKT